MFLIYFAFAYDGNFSKDITIDECVEIVKSQFFLTIAHFLVSPMQRTINVDIINLPYFIMNVHIIVLTLYVYLKNSYVYLLYMLILISFGI